MPTGLDVFDNSIQKTNELLHAIEVELGWENHRNQSYAVLRAILHTFRDRLTIIDASNFAAQLPLLLKGVFYDGWKPENAPMKMDVNEFTERIRCEITLDIKIEIPELIQKVMTQLFTTLDPLEANKIKTLLPKEFSGLFFSEYL